MDNNTMIDLQSFFPTDCLRIDSLEESENTITIKLKSITNNSRCSKCGRETSQYHGTYVRKVQDLPIFGKTVHLNVTAHEYSCINPECGAKTFVEDFDGFLQYYSRMTERCSDLICTLALETSCEGSARICKAMGIKTSGDSIIRLLIKRYENQPSLTCGAIVGVDDFAFKKRHTYGTIIVDEATHKTVALLNGRDGDSLEEWLKSNQHVKAVTRDRASAYAKVITEVLPDAMQIADRFHLHQNLLDTIKQVLNREIPATIKIPHGDQDQQEATSVNQTEESCKKNACHCG